MDLNEILTDDTNVPSGTPTEIMTPETYKKLQDEAEMVKFDAYNKALKDQGFLGSIGSMAKNVLLGNSSNYLGDTLNDVPVKPGVAPMGETYHRMVGIPAAVGLGAGAAGAAVEAALPVAEAFPTALQAGGRLLAKTAGQGAGALAAREATGDPDALRNAGLDTALMGGISTVFPFLKGAGSAMFGKRIPDITSWGENAASRLFGKTTGLPGSVSGDTPVDAALSTITKAIAPGKTAFDTSGKATVPQVVKEAHDLGAFENLPRNPERGADSLAALDGKLRQKLGKYRMVDVDETGEALKHSYALKESGELGEKLSSSADTLGLHSSGQVEIFPLWDTIKKAADKAAMNFPATEAAGIKTATAKWISQTEARLAETNETLGKVFKDYVETKSKYDLAKIESDKLAPVKDEFGSWIRKPGYEEALATTKKLEGELNSLKADYDHASVPFSVMADEVHKMGQLINPKRYMNVQTTVGETEGNSIVHDTVSAELQRMAKLISEKAAGTKLGKAASDYIDATKEWGIWSKLSNFVGGLAGKSAVSLRGVEGRGGSFLGKGIVGRTANAASRLMSPTSINEQNLRAGLRELDAANLFAGPKIPNEPGISKTAITAAAMDDLLPPTPSKLPRKPGTVRGMAPQILSTIPPDEQQNFMGAVKDSDENLSRYMLNLFQKYPQLEGQFEEDKEKIKSFGGVINPQDQGVAFNDVVTGIFNNPTKNRSTDAYWKTRKIIQGSAIG